jgi:Dolichyl-phosphate-mannose-protein mannosyltransferase
VLSIDWSTLGLQLGAFVVILAYAIAGSRGVTTQRESQLSIIGLWVSRILLPVTSHREWFLVSAFVLAAGISAMLIGQFIFQDFPFSGDEWSYFLQAEIFSRGRLQVDSPPHPRFFDVWAMVNNGKFYSWAPPGWPLLLLPGILLGVPWLVNPVLSALTLLIVYRLGELVYDRATSLLALFFMLFSPFFILHSASYLAHPSSLFFIALCVFFYARGIEKEASRDFFLAGLCGSMSFLIRPFDQVAIFSPLGAYLLLLVLKRKVAVRQLLWLAVSHTLGVLLMLAYNYLQTGNPLTVGYHVGYDGSLFDLRLLGRQFIAEYLLHLLVWTFPFLPLLALLYNIWPGATGRRSLTEQRWDTLLLLVFLSNVFWYAFVPFHYWAGYGPRYYYGSFFAVALLGARGAMALMNRLKTRAAGEVRVGFAAVALGICLTLSLSWVFPVKLIEAYRRIDARLALYHKVAEEKLQNAVVFIRSVDEEFAPWNLTRNTSDFRGTVLYVHDLGELNHLFIKQHPGRQFFRYEYDETKKPILREITPEVAIKEASGSKERLTRER